MPSVAPPESGLELDYVYGYTAPGQAGLLGAPALDVEPRSAQGVSLECCALVRTSERQWKLLTAVELDHENAAVSGYAQTRTLKTGKAHLLRWHDAATKKYLTHAAALERRDVLVVADAVGQRDVDVGRGLLEREVPGQRRARHEHLHLMVY